MMLIHRILLTSILIRVTISNVVTNSNDTPLGECDILLNLTGVGIKRLPNVLVKGNSVTHLILDDNEISSVSSEVFSSSTKLSYLSIAKNKLSTLNLDPFSQLENLKTLILNENCDFTTVQRYLTERRPGPIYHGSRYDYETTETMTTEMYMTYDEYGYPYYRRTTIRSEVKSEYCTFEFDAELPNLTHLFIENNNLKSISFTFVKFSALTHFYISHNPVELDQETLSNLTIFAPALTHLYLQNCNISQFSVLNLPNITALYLDNNNVESICNNNCGFGASSLILDGARKLESLSISYNQISLIDTESFHYMNNLTVLDLSHNHILQIRNGTFDKLHMLQSLSLEYNNIMYLKDIGMFGSLTSLQNLSLAHNNIMSIAEGVFGNLVSLKILRLDHNKISNLEVGVFSNLTSLETLSLAGNQLTKIHEKSLPISGLLTSLNLDENRFNHLENISLSTLPSIILLSLKSNPLTIIPARWFIPVSSNLTIFL